MCDACDPIIAARDVDGQLVVAYLGYGTPSSYTVGLARGDGLGRYLRVVRSIGVPFDITPKGVLDRGVLLAGSPTGTLSRDGLAAIATYEDTETGKFMRVAILPLEG